MHAWQSLFNPRVPELARRGYPSLWWSVGRFAGVELRIHASWWLLLLAFGAAEYSVFLPFGSLARSSGGSAASVHSGFLVDADLTSIGLALVGVAVIALSLGIHELGHVVGGAFVGRKPKSVQFFGLGASTLHSFPASSPYRAILSASSGPLANILLGLASILTALLLLPANSTIYRVAIAIGLINLVFALGNLLPVYPQDGGLIIYALFWKRTGSPRRAIKLTARIGLAFALFSASAGILLIVLGWGAYGVLLVAQAAIFWTIVHRSAREALDSLPLSA